MNFLPKDYDLQKAWRKVDPPFDHPAFVTHSNYLDFLRRHSKNLALKCNSDIKNKAALKKTATQKVRLFNLTLSNLIEEKKNVDKYPEYSIVCSSWIPVKSYYLIFNLLIILEYLLSADENALNSTHTWLHKRLIEHIDKGELEFSEVIFNKIIAVGKAEVWKVPVHENVKSKNYDPEVRFKQIIRKIKDYKKEDFKIREKVKRLAGKRKYIFYKQKINICEFFYWYRIKANYRDMEFIEQDVKTEDFVKFYIDYHEL